MEQRTKIDIFEAAFRKIKEATGVSDVNEVIQKIVSQESTTDNLMSTLLKKQTRVPSSRNAGRETARASVRAGLSVFVFPRRKEETNRARCLFGGENARRTTIGSEQRELIYPLCLSCYTTAARVSFSETASRRSHWRIFDQA